MRILIIEDEARLASTIADIVTSAGYQTDISMDGEEGFEFAVSGIYDAVILDVMLPGMNGYQILSGLRNRKESIPVLMLTARTELEDKIKGLDLGADCYLTKPFENKELMACLRAVLRRQGTLIQEILECGDLSLVPGTCELRCRDNTVSLSAKELDLMQILMRNSNRYLSKELLLLKVWGYEADINDNNVEAYMSFIRKKLKLIKSRMQIGVIRKVGYRLEEPSL
ncbi:MAG: response regulator transcription factor [Lachnospiraceae bacterium]